MAHQRAFFSMLTKVFVGGIAALRYRTQPRRASSRSVSSRWNNAKSPLARAAACRSVEDPEPLRIGGGGGAEDTGDRSPAVGGGWAVWPLPPPRRSSRRPYSWPIQGMW